MSVVVGSRFKSPDRRAKSTERRASSQSRSTAKQGSDVGSSTKGDKILNAKITYKYLILSGNEPSLIRDSLARRSWWVEAKGQEKWNFWWGGNGQKFNFDDLSSGGSRQPLTGAGPVGPSASLQRIANRLPEHRQLCTKSGLASNLAEILKRARNSTGSTASCNWIPETHVLEGGKGAGGKSKPGSFDPALDRFMASYKSHATARSTAASAAIFPQALTARTDSSLESSGGGVKEEGGAAGASRAGRVWIAKPTNMNRGNGIEIFDNLKDILKFLETRKSGTKWVVQKYIEDPMLVQGRKFDIRAYVLVVPAAASPGGAATNPDGAVFLHKEAYIRTSGTPFNPDDFTDKTAHLTNDAVQKLKPETYHAFEDHCKLSLDELQSQLVRDGSVEDRDFVRRSVWPAMRDCVASLFGSTLAALNPRRAKHCFELLGLDFMIDRAGQVYLVEVNTSPALFRAGAYLADLLPRVVEEIAQKVLDPIFSNPGRTGGEGSDSAAEGATELLDGFVRVEL